MLDKPFLLRNFILPYDWGSVTQIPKLLGCDENPGKPKAELWMGVHPKAPSQLYFKDRWISLDKLIALHPSDMLGTRAAEKFNNTLPFLFKVLAIENPLSIQVHPNAEQACKGFQEENEKGIDISSKKRTYLDNRAKPELICAYTDLSVLAGFRSPKDIRLQLIDLGISGLTNDILDNAKANDNPADWRKRFFEDLITADASRKTEIILSAKSAAKKRTTDDPACKWVLELANRFPEDVCLLAPVFLNLIKLKPGEAMFLDAGRLHCYLKGMGIELMSNSDNVIRCGLTAKQVGTEKLLKVVSYENPQATKIVADPLSSGEHFYSTPADTFVLSKLFISKAKPYDGPSERSIEILLCTEGAAKIWTNHKRFTMAIRKGQSILMPSSLGGYQITGAAVAFKAGIPL